MAPAGAEKENGYESCEEERAERAGYDDGCYLARGERGRRGYWCRGRGCGGGGAGSGEDGGHGGAGVRLVLLLS